MPETSGKQNWSTTKDVQGFRRLPRRRVEALEMAAYIETKTGTAEKKFTPLNGNYFCNFILLTYESKLLVTFIILIFLVFL